MIVARCKNCNYTARYNSKYFTIAELQRHTISLPLEKWECNHLMTYEEENKNSNGCKSYKTERSTAENLTQFSSETNPVEVVYN